MDTTNNNSAVRFLLSWVVLFATTMVMVHCAEEDCIVVAPSSVRLGAEETIVVLNQGEPKFVTLHVQDYPAKLHTFHRETMRLQKDGSQLVRLHISPENFNPDYLGPTQRKYVSVSVDCGAIYRKQAKLLVSEKSGYVFLQTDKPIYTPKQQVRIRFVAVSENFVPSPGPFSLEIKNPQEIVTYRTTLEQKDNQTSLGMFSHTYTFPKSPLLGEWKVVIAYGAHYAQTTEVKFKLDEYVLPTFSVNLTVPDVILPDQDRITGSVSAMYVYGKPVEGSAAFRFRIKNEANNETEVGSLSPKDLSNGRADFSILTNEFKVPRGQRWAPMVQGNRLVVEAVVMDGATSKRESSIDDSAIFANTPYIISFKSTPMDFRPGTETIIVVDVEHLNSRPAANVRVEISVVDDQEQAVHVESPVTSTDENGKAIFFVPTVTSYTLLKCRVRTADSKYQYNQQATGTLVLEPYQSPPETMLAIKRLDTRRTLMVGETFHGDVTVKPNDTYPIYYVVTSRGRVESYGTLGGGDVIQKSLHFRVNQNMAPLVRILVYAFHNRHLLADSLALEVEQVCKSDAQIDIEPDFPSEEPGSNGVIRVRGTQGALVGILAVDKAVYILSNKELLTRSKMFSALKSHDIGCGPGGGLTSDVVLDNSGVVMISRHIPENDARIDRSCEARIRKRRSRMLISQQRHQDPYLRQCCALGQKRDRMGRDCTTRANIVRRFLTDDRGAQCAESFLQCCTATAVHVMGARPAGLPELALDRGRVNPNKQDLDELDREFDEENIPLRSNFQETWLFEEKTIPASGLAEFHASLPHSITKWSLQAVAVSPAAGVCVAREKDVTSFRSVFLQVSLPYKVVRNEQIEVLVTVYNYGSRSLNGYVYMIGKEGLCSGAAPGRKTEKKRVHVAANSATSVTFPVIPLREGEFEVQVYVVTTRGQDNVLKILNVVPEGITVEKSVSVPIDPTNERRRKTRSIRGDLYQDSLDPAARVQVIAVNTRLPPDAVPDTKYCSLSVIGDKVGPSTHNTLDNLDNLISLPRGCGEQNMMLMAPTLYTLDYLKHKGTINETTEDKAYEYVRTGYERQLTYRKEDGSFSAFRHRDSSVWLTAFVLRVFCKARFYVNIDPAVVNSGIIWLASQQKPDGSFREIKPILHKTMLGGIRGMTPMTAFVLLTLQECSNGKSSAQHETILKATARAENFLRQGLGDIEEPYIAALVAYSLSLSQRPGQEEAFEILKNLMIYDPGLNTRSTGEDSTPLVVEGTSYALLASLRQDDVEFSKSIVNWLNMHRSATGSFTSTQDTVVALQALSEFAMKSREGFLDLTCNVTLSNKKDFKQSIRVRRDNAAVLQQFELNDVRGKMFVSASGIGSGLLSVKLKYNVMVPPEMLCKFNLTVKADVHIPRATHSRQFTFPSDLLDELLGPERERRSLSGHRYRLSAPSLQKGASRWHEPAWDSTASRSSYSYDPRHRVGSGSLSGDPGNSGQPQGPQASKLTYDIEVCTRYLVGGDSNMAAAEVGIFSGFEPIKEDLDKLHRDKVIDRYEIGDKSIVFYFEKISTDKQTCISFRVQRQYIVTNLQAAVVKVYDYYNPMHSCSQFYGPGSTSPLLKLVCEGSQCQCAESGCPSKNPFESVLDVIRHGPLRPREQLAEIACNEHDFVWQGRVVDTTQSNGFRKIVFRVDKVIKEGSERAVDVQGYDRQFITRDHCTTADLVRGDQYVIFAQDSEPFEDNGRILRQYALDQTARIFSYNSTSQETYQLRPIFTWLLLGFEKRGGCID